ncbi:DUF2335 domain-containing protein [Leyella lascolaii]|uniref:DUF2335 domain-containing protein n=1 Tax=Leyella lascolaii TaxID=1776379 RepID=A0AAW7JS45_9BACT|nr:DUF2335 domain-containing protein [Leyella lascolaii]MDN0023362.1 DUF2335 domain-containing protein [Leyella lascolaii]MDN0024725.1 DUF2335 domain-containing protein [Leyella lascolaii]
MAKQQIRQKETEVSTQDGVGKQLERTLTVDDSSLPSPQELAAYKEVDPNIVTFLMESASLEQKHRHNIDKSKIDIIKKSETRISRTKSVQCLSVGLSQYVTPKPVLNSLLPYA